MAEPKNARDSRMNEFFFNTSELSTQVPCRAFVRRLLKHIPRNELTEIFEQKGSAMKKVKEGVSSTLCRWLEAVRSHTFFLCGAGFIFAAVGLLFVPGLSFAATVAASIQWTGGTCCGQNQQQYIHDPQAILNYYHSMTPPFPSAYTTCSSTPAYVGQSCYVYAWYTNVGYSATAYCEEGTLDSNGTTCTRPDNSPDPNKGEGAPDSGSCQGNPCNAGNGNKYQAQLDYQGSGTYPLQAERIYNSGGTSPSAVQLTDWGSQWRGFYDRSVKYGTDGTTLKTAFVKRADGKTYYFSQAIGMATPPLTTTTWTPDADVVGTLTSSGMDANNNPTGWTYVNGQDETETYDAAGKLMSIKNRAGQTQTLVYSDGTTGANGGFLLDVNGNPTTTALPAGKLIRVTDSAGRILQYGYDIATRVVKMTDPAGGVYVFAYSDGTRVANLATVKYPDGKVRTYLYGETANVSSTPLAGVSYVHSLTGILDENGTRYASWTYDSAARATSSEHGAMGSGIDHVGLVFTAPDANGNSTTAVTDVMGVTRTYGFATLLGVVKNNGITGQPCNGCTAAFGHDANGNVASRTDFNGNSTCYAYDLTRNLETVRLEGVPSGTACPASLPVTALTGVERQITTQWNANYRLPTMVAEPLRITTYTYDASGNLLTRTVQPTSDPTGAQGFSAAAAGTARTWTYTYNAAGQVLTVDGPRTDVSDITTYAYDTQGNLSSVTNALGRVTVIGSYDANGRPGVIAAPNGLGTILIYDARGRLLSRNVGGEITTYTYDGVGNLTGVSLPSGASYSYTYDAAHRLTQIADALNNKLVYTLDNAGNRTKEQLFDSSGNTLQTHSRVFDALNHLYQDIGAVNQTTTYTYDNAGNVLTITDPLNRLTSNVYDALNRLSQVTNPDNGVIRYGHDGLDQLIGVSDPRSLVTQYSRDGLGNLNQQTSPDTGATNLTYDAAGNVLTRTDAKGQVASYTYDALNRISTISYAGSPNLTVTYTYDQSVNGFGHLTGISDATGAVSYSYDQHGRLLSETAQHYNAVYITSYSYDAQGRLNAINYPSGRLVNYTLDSLGRISSIATSFNGNTQVLASSIVYRPFGGVQAFVHGDGTATPLQIYTRQYDQDGRVASYTLNGHAMNIGYDAASQISFIADPANLANAANYTYDPMSRLTGYTQGAANQSFGYDVDGNRISQLIGSTNTTYSFGTTSNWLTAIQTGANNQSVAHDANGATTSDATKQYSYDVRGRLIQTTTAQGVVNYEINALGLRLRKQVPYANTDTEYHYDTAGHLIAESPTGTTQFAREYIYLGDIPVAVMQ